MELLKGVGVLCAAAFVLLLYDNVEKPPAGCTTRRSMLGPPKSRLNIFVQIVSLFRQSVQEPTAHTRRIAQRQCYTMIREMVNKDWRALEFVPTSSYLLQDDQFVLSIVDSIPT